MCLLLLVLLCSHATLTSRRRRLLHKQKQTYIHTRTCGHFIDFSHTQTHIGKILGEISEATMRIRKSIRPKMQQQFTALLLLLCVVQPPFPTRTLTALSLLRPRFRFRSLSFALSVVLSRDAASRPVVSCLQLHTPFLGTHYTNSTHSKKNTYTYNEQQYTMHPLFNLLFIFLWGAQ